MNNLNAIDVCNHEQDYVGGVGHLSGADLSGPRRTVGSLGPTPAQADYSQYFGRIIQIT